MSKQYPGGFIIKNPTTPTTSSAPGMWTLDQAAYYIKQGTWPSPIAIDPYFKYVSMLLHGNGSASGTSNVLPFNSDASTNNYNLTINGDTKSNNFTPFQGNGYYSNSFNGTTDYLTVPLAAYDFGTGAFTCEAWVYIKSVSTASEIFYGSVSGGALDELQIVVQANQALGWETNNSISNSGGVIPLNAWTHIAVVRNGSTITGYVNGTSVGTTTDSGAITPTTHSLIGSYRGSSVFAKGFISNARVTKAAVYTSNFTPSTTPLAAIANTSLLTCQSSRFIDNSTNSYAITPSSTVAVSPAQPFTLSTDSATYGSGYFDGTGDSLTINGGTGASAAADFTYEVWIYPTTVSPTYQQIVHGTSLNGAYGFQLLLNGSTLYIWNNLSHQTAVVANQWSHVAVVRSSNTVRLYLNGVQSTNSISTSSTATIITIGTNGAGGTENFNGYQSNGRFVAGTAVYTSTFTPPTSPLTAIANTALLTEQYNGAGNNNGFKDSSLNNFVITRNGNTTQGTFTPYGSNWSNYFDGSGDYLTVPSSSLFKPASSNFTIEAWVFVSNTGTQQQVYGDCDSGTNNGICLLSISSGLKVEVDYFTSSTAVVTKLTTGSVQANAWNHICVSKTGTTMYIGYNGTLETFTGIPSTMQSPATIYPTIARLGAYNGLYVNGYISNFRYVIGSAVYTGLTYTVPTTPLTAISGTSILTCQSNRFIDNSANALTITRNGDTNVQRFSPFAPTSGYSTSVIGGSAYFDGTGDYLGVANNVNATGNFTYEFWMYATGFGSGGYGTMVGASSGSASNIFQLQTWSGATSRILGYVGAASGAGNLSPTLSQTVLNRWIHIAVVRSGSTVTMYENGVSVATLTMSNTINFGSTMQVGADGAANYSFQGYLTDSRLVIGTAVYTSTFTPPTAPLTAISGTTVLLSATNAAIYDNAMISDQETVGNATVSTKVKKYGDASMYFDGTGDGLQVVGSPNTAFGTGDFTVEFWIYLNASTGSFKKFVELGTSGACFTIETQSTTNVLTITDLNTTVFVTSSSALSLTTWTHVAATRSGTTLRLFQNGTQVGSATNSTNFANSGNVYIGQSNSGQAINAYMDDLRITKGYARYTANFTPPTSQLPDQ
jgi:hypothetical protein